MAGASGSLTSFFVVEDMNHTSFLSWYYSSEFGKMSHKHLTAPALPLLETADGAFNAL
jgi:hypothetical protein